MPTYDYLCESCDHRFEAFQSMTQKPLRKCPQCKKAKLQRLIGAGAGVIFKGSGFYQTDYRSEAFQQDAKKDTAPAPKDDGGKESGAKAGVAKESGPCAETCGTSDAPTGCKMPPKSASKGSKGNKDK